jgi:predicted aspartyl protease
MDVLQLTRREAVLALGAAALPLGRAQAAATPISAPILLEGGRLWVNARVAGSETLRFVIDTGAGRNFLRPEIAKRLKLKILGGSMVGGVGGKSALTGIVEANDIVIADVMRQKAMLFSTYDFGRGLARDAAGLFAAGLITAYDSDLNFGTGRWQIWPKGRDAQLTGTQLSAAAITAKGGYGSERIYVSAMIDDKPYRLLVDTGAPFSLVLFSRATARSGLADGRPSAPVVTSGFGGRADKLSTIVRADRFALGPLAFNRPFVKLMDDVGPTLPDADGIIGLPLITMLDWSTDVGRNRVWVTRNANGLVADRYPRSGLWLDTAANGNVIVAGVGIGGPGAAAGIRVGDTIVEPTTLADAIRRINGPVGQAITLTTRRDDATITVTIVPKSYLSGQ